MAQSLPKILTYILTFALYFLNIQLSNAQDPRFKVIAFYTGKNDRAHVSFVHEANKWFPKMAAKNNFSYDSTNNWSNLNAEFLSKYQVVLFLDTRPEAPEQRLAFQKSKVYSRAKKIKNESQ